MKIFKPHPFVANGPESTGFDSLEEATMLLLEIAETYRSRIDGDRYSGFKAAAWRPIKGPRSRTARNCNMTHQFLEVSLYTPGILDGKQHWVLSCKPCACYRTREKLAAMISHPCKPK